MMIGEQQMRQGLILLAQTTSQAEVSKGSVEQEYWNKLLDYFKQGSEQSCELLGSLGIFLQGLLFIVSFSTLIIKRCLEQQKRPWKIFFMDTSKQVFSSGLLHTYNIVFSWILSNGDNVQCQWYFINFCIDIFGIAGFSYLFIKLFRKALIKRDIHLELGNYGPQFEASRREGTLEITPEVKKLWLAQLIYWLFIISLSKLCILLGILAFKDFWLYLGIFALYPIQKYPRLLLLVVMVLVPVGFNALQFWILDEFLKQRRPVRSHSSQEGTGGASYAEDLNSYDDDEEYERKLLNQNSDNDESLSHKSGDANQNYGTMGHQ